MIVLGVVLSTLILSVSCQFSNPHDEAFGRTIFRTGEVETIQYKTTFPNYTVALWQQSLTQGTARLGPIVFQTTDNADATDQFDWLVQTYDFDLEGSNVFFLWMFQGDPSKQGDGSSPDQMSSAYFNITSEPAESSSAAPSTAPSATTSTTSSGTGNPTTTNGSEAYGQSGGLTTGAQAGIGVGVSVAGLAVIAGVAVCFRHMRRQQRQLAELRDQSYQQTLSASYAPSYAPPPPKQETPSEIGPAYREPVELPPTHHASRESPVELG